ncbi:hypothetical protein RRG08_058820 [Elysia crispata]|uniref:Uncharacterized protein n=1 Tax=Elysia crispata TaxID=231223 RepID=A0AAE1D5B1_9GAST|nr:hypothetical protein RRG08_058820 [Elysia crispata]
MCKQMFLITKRIGLHDPEWDLANSSDSFSQNMSLSDGIHIKSRQQLPQNFVFARGSIFSVSTELTPIALAADTLPQTLLIQYRRVIHKYEGLDDFKLELELLQLFFHSISARCFP